ncbi:MAG: hypothetical protein IKR09_02205 [Alphaproteobacteria bacterium]|nr:hypothetical protein [Alphaproteobacteria bacterium]
MKSMFGKFCAIGLFANAFFLSSAIAIENTASDLSRQFSSEPSVSEKHRLPAEAVAIPEEDLKSAAPITFDELRLFVRDWRKYARWLKTDGNEYKAVAYLGVSRSADYPVEVVKWMDEHGWAVDRFFLLERKFRMTLSVQKQEAKQTLLSNHMEQMLEQLENDPSKNEDEKKALRRQYASTIRSIHAATSIKAPVSPEEYKLIKLNHDALEKILAE